MSADDCLDHSWLSQDVKYMRAKRLSTVKHKRFLARRKWQVRELHFSDGSPSRHKRASREASRSSAVNEVNNNSSEA